MRLSIGTGMFDIIHLNFFSIVTAISLAFNLLAALFLLFAMQRKSATTLHFGLAMLGAAGLSLGYGLGSVIYHPWAAYHRYVTVLASPIVFIHLAQLLYLYPRGKPTLASRIALMVQYGLMALVVGYFMYKAPEGGYVYNFLGHNWDFDADVLSKRFGYFLLLYISHVVVVGIISTLKNRGRERMVSGVITGVLVYAMVLPGILNALARDGLIAWNVFQIFLTGNTITGFFVVLVFYINTVRERSSFMVKIVGISLATFLLVLSGINFIVFLDKDDAYDAVHREQAARLVNERDFEVSDVSYLLDYDLKRNEFEFTRRFEGASPAVDELREEFLNTMLHEKIRRLSLNAWPGNLNELLAKSHPFFQGYKGAIQSKLSEGADRKQIFDFLSDMQSTILYRYNKIRKLPDENFREKVLPLLNSLGGASLAFKAPVLAYLKQNPELKGAALKVQVLRFFRPVNPVGSRFYRFDREDRRHYVSYMYYKPGDEKIYEAGFSYLLYREYVDVLAWKQGVILLVVILVIVMGYRFFFLGALVQPLDTLLKGVARVNKGNLDVHIKVKVEDEIGFLTRSFNRMVGSIKNAREKLEQYADELEEKVRARTSELESSLQSVQDLKVQQDGDYFLTSLIIKPLATNKAKSETVNIEIFMKQKKHFEFRKWKEEIGGDICSAHSIMLGDRPHTVFLNADAMGKSIQGAGGALVLGAVFESIIERTHLVHEGREIYPENWMKNAFIELQKVFEVFEGSMLVSLVLGMVDDGTGLVYYINAEHPWTVLYRGGQAVFIEHELKYHKLGIMGLKGKISVSTVQMEPGDVLIAGSDGRDDILLGTTEEGKRNISEDENLFLGTVEKGGGRLGPICDDLLGRGELTDDLSLIRIAYLEDSPARENISSIGAVADLVRKARDLSEKEQYGEAEATLREAMEAGRGAPKIRKQLVRLYVKMKNYEGATLEAEEYISMRPMDTEMIYLTSFLEKKREKFPLAAALGERVRIRMPTMTRNLLNLSEIYLALSNWTRAEKLIQEILNAEPENERALKLKESLRMGKKGR